MIYTKSLRDYNGVKMQRFKAGVTMDFYKRTALVCSIIPEGKVSTYGQIALLCGKPKHARQVGYALSRGLAGEDAPAHRVVLSLIHISDEKDSGILGGPTCQK